MYNSEINAKIDIFKNATAYLTQRLFQNPKTPVDDRAFFMQSALVIIGFVAYQLMIASWLRTENYVNGSAKIALDDTLKFMTMFAITRLLSGGSLSDPEWIKQSGLFIAAIVAYDMLLHNMVNNKLTSLQPTTALAVNDVLKWGSVFAMHNFAMQGEFDRSWMLSTGGFCLGYVIYDLFIGKYTEKLF